MTTKTTTNLQDFARQLHTWGASVTAIKLGTKRPAHKWQQWQAERQTRAELDALPWHTAAAVGVVNGSGDFRVFDIDAAKDGDGAPVGPVPESVVIELLTALGLPDDYQWSYRSGSGAGYGVVIRCAEPLPPDWAAVAARPSGVYVGRPADGRPFGQLELRWSTGQTVIDGAHPTGPGYQWRLGERPFVPPAMRTAAQVVTAFTAIAEHVADFRPTTAAHAPAPAPSPAGHVNGATSEAADGAATSATEKYAAAALADAIRQVSTAAPGDRNKALFRQTAGLAELVNGQVLTRDKVDRAMTGAALAAGLTADETAATIASAFAHVGDVSRTPKPSANGHKRPSTGPRFKVGDAVNVVVSGGLMNPSPCTVTTVHPPHNGTYGYVVAGVVYDDNGAPCEGNYHYEEANLEPADASATGDDGAAVDLAQSLGGVDPTPAPSPVTFKLDDTGNAERFVTQHGDDVRYDHSTRHWLMWTGTHWRMDDDGAAQRRAKITARAIYEEAAAAARVGNDDLAAQSSKWARASAAESRRNAMLNLAQAELPIALTHDRLNTHDLLVNVQNGTIDLATGTIRPHDRRDLLTYVLPVAYDPTAGCPTWVNFLWRITNDDDDLADFLARAVGYTLSGLTTEQCLFFLHGRGANGKSTFVETVMALLGDLGHKARAQVLMLSERERVSNEVAALAGRRLVVTSELSDGGRLDEGLVKDLTGGDTMSARFLYGEPFTFRPTFKLWLYGNHKPTIAGTDDGIWRRVRLIPFTVQIPEKERDATLPAKLRAELPGILTWALRGWQDFQRHGLGTPAAVTQATAEYRSESDVMGIFLEERCRLHDGATAEAGKLYAAYCEWATENGLRPMSNVRFAKSLSERGFAKDKNTANGRMEYQNIWLPG